RAAHHGRDPERQWRVGALWLRRSWERTSARPRHRGSRPAPEPSAHRRGPPPPSGPRMDLHPPDAVRDIARRLEDAGYETWAVGGAVRDALLGLVPGDWDLATRARPRDVRRLFRRTIPIGVEHGTVGVLGRDRVLYEVTTFRRDVETTGRHA